VPASLSRERQRLVHDGDRQFVGEELTAGDHLGELVWRCATGVRPVPQELTRRNQRHAEMAGETDALRAFAGTRFTEQSEPHGTSVSGVIRRSWTRVIADTFVNPDRGDEHRLDRVPPILGLVEHDARRRFEQLVGDLEPVGGAHETSQLETLISRAAGGR